mmetsp:Transcript_41783/g.111961  ORF Transcript_41783/g.111961 Transcript_41783/m.111961 type:complete len:80 (-) Transcript_41783:514-753(-)|eukprot:CAMPEP_0113668106 /NCGR_PEP_ID=MMETSP0038_2-20120614/3813_1 /TAXON_ID=2898 /ORGANISM="Cryptomonas paramecium" /LENGTH=79 /DNA_ID=CAMNT_0000583807 /DNA_START=158 /DNA_END=397 /DNA_ORIENTATION=- /assembly_acc=CAM_ASM_000170
MGGGVPSEAQGLKALGEGRTGGMALSGVDGSEWAEVVGGRGGRAADPRLRGCGGGGAAFWACDASWAGAERLLTVGVSL